MQRVKWFRKRNISFFNWKRIIDLKDNGSGKFEFKEYQTIKNITMCSIKAILLGFLILGVCQSGNYMNFFQMFWIFLALGSPVHRVKRLKHNNNSCNAMTSEKKIICDKNVVGHKSTAIKIIFCRYCNTFSIIVIHGSILRLVKNCLWTFFFLR